ncbi:MAG: hypothetical protein ACSHYB_13420 [Roseibacillus sp.]
MLTPVDHWLREKLLLQTHVYTLRLPEKLPRGIKVRELPVSPSNKYRYRMIANSNSSADKLITKLGEGGLMFKTQVVEKKTVLKPIISPKGGSVLLSVFWMVSLMGLTYGSLKMFKKLTSDPIFMENLKEAVAIFAEN